MHDLQLTIKDVITNDSLHTQALCTILPLALADIINNTQLSFNPTIVDAYVWPQNKNGIYTSKCGYNWLLSLHEADNHSSVSWNWRLKVHEKIKFLIWLACHDATPTLAFAKSQEHGKLSYLLKMR